MAKYAENTTVSVDKSLAEIQRTLKRYDAKDIGHQIVDSPPMCIFFFRLQGFGIKIVQPLSDIEKEERRLMRVLLIRIKSRLEEMREDIPAGEAFMPYLVLQDGLTVKDAVAETLSNGQITAGSDTIRRLLLPPNQ